MNKLQVRVLDENDAISFNNNNNNSNHEEREREKGEDVVSKITNYLTRQSFICRIK
jgi:hypothetical protein